MTTIRGLRINSVDGGHYAVVIEERPGDVSVTIWHRVTRPDRALARLISSDRLDCAFHAACERVHAILYRMAHQE